MKPNPANVSSALGPAPTVVKLANLPISRAIVFQSAQKRHLSRQTLSFRSKESAFVFFSHQILGMSHQPVAPVMKNVPYAMDRLRQIVSQVTTIQPLSVVISSSTIHVSLGAPLGLSLEMDFVFRAMTNVLNVPEMVCTTVNFACMLKSRMSVLQPVHKGSSL